jgi:predicted phage baseplate assembly protein
MPLPLPLLGDRDFDQLVSEGRGLLPRLAPTWTDYNASDPGITLMELLASRTEQAMYRLDRTPPALARAFARRVGVEPRTAQVADTVLEVRAGNAPIVLPAGTQVAGADGVAVFQTSEPVFVSAAALVRVVAAGGDAGAADAAGEGGWRPFGVDPAPGDALYLGFDQPLAAPGVALRLQAWTTTAAADRATAAALAAEMQAEQADAASCAAGCAPVVADWRAHYGVRTAWEFHRGGGAWQALDGVADATRALSLTGAIEFLAPAGHAAGGPALDPALYFLRCRIVQGRFDCAPRLARLGFNTVVARHAVDLDAPEALGTSLGRAFERWPLARAPVVPGSCALTVTTPSGPDTGWQERADFERSGPHDEHYVLDAQAATITGGDGLVARAWPARGALAIVYQVGGGTGGNLAAATLVRACDSALNRSRYQAANGGADPDWTQLAFAQPFAALGGADAESLADTEARAFAAAFAQDRAVTCADIVRLALAAPGLPVARAQAIADRHPSLPCVDAAGCVSVIVVPACPAVRPDPTPALLAAVARWLERRRVVTTEIHVRPVRWLGVAVDAVLCSDGRFAADALAGAARAALAAFFDPLAGGPDGGGWPIGRSVWRTEVLAVLSGVPGVAAVAGLGLRAEGDDGARCGNVDLCPDALVRLGEVALRVTGPARPPIIDRSKPHECP